MNLWHNGVIIPSWASVVFADEAKKYAGMTEPGDAPPRTFDVAWPDVGYYCVALSWSNGLEFRVLKFNRHAPDTIMFRSADGYNETTEAEDAERLMAGCVKWDGCMNVNISTGDGVMLHFCGRREATAVGVVLNRLYDLAVSHVGHWMGEQEWERPAWEVMPAEAET